MEYTDINDQGIQATIRDWIAASGELFVEVYYPHSGGGGTYYLVVTFDDCTQLGRETRVGELFFILQTQQFPIRGVVDDAFIARALHAIPDGTTYLITDLVPYLVPYPTPLAYGDGYSHAKLLQDLAERRGNYVGIGGLPDTNPTYWIADARLDRITTIKQ